MTTATKKHVRNILLYSHEVLYSLYDLIDGSYIFISQVFLAVTRPAATTVFCADGHIFLVEYAFEAVCKGSTIVSIKKQRHWGLYGWQQKKMTRSGAEVTCAVHY
jgi:hypothetical protein